MKLLTHKTLTIATLGLAVALVGCERPPVEVEQLGFRGTGMEQVTNPRTEAALLKLNQAPVPLPAVSQEGPRAGDIYQNLQVLGHLSIAELNRQMAAHVQWIAPEQGCSYCHDTSNFALDARYTKVVARNMLRLTQHMNEEWKDHVAETGVTCYTCHRGQNVPEYSWYTDTMSRQAGGFAADRQGMNMAGVANTAYSSLPYDALTELLGKPTGELRVVPLTALPYTNRQGASIQQTYNTFSLMMHVSESLGVNCTYCHNSRNFFDWTESPAARTVAWYGIEMTRHANVNYVEPLSAVLPADRLGPRGDIAKIGCDTCHQGLALPLNGVSMVPDYPALFGISGDATPPIDAELPAADSLLGPGRD